MNNPYQVLTKSFTRLKHPNPKQYSIINLPDGSLNIEIGAGVGLHAIQYAQAHPDRTLYAIEKTPVKFNKMKRRYDTHHEPDNLKLIHGNAITWITHALPENSVDRYFILYPNPNPKNRAQRFHAMSFMSLLIKTLKNHGTITLATNMQFYAEEAKIYFTGPWALTLRSETLISKDQTPDFIPRSHFERKYLLSGQLCYNMVYVKKND